MGRGDHAKRGGWGDGRATGCLAFAMRHQHSAPMRFVLALILARLSLPAPAQEWGRYVNERFGVAVDVPPGFAAGEPPANGDGLQFTTPTAELAVFGSFLDSGDFERDIAQRIDY